MRLKFSCGLFLGLLCFYAANAFAQEAEAQDTESASPVVQEQIPEKEKTEPAEKRQEQATETTKESVGKQKVQAPDTAQESGEEQESKIRLALVDFACVDVSDGIAASLSDSARRIFSEIGLYHVLSRDEMIGTLTTLGRKIPKGCIDTHCLLKIGRLLALYKSVGGEISYDGINYAVKMTMVDISTGKPEARVWIASQCSDQDLSMLVGAAIQKLHGQEPESLSIKIKDYRGPEFSKHNLWAITAGGTFAIGIFYAVIDGGLTGRDKNRNEFSQSQYGKLDDPLSGIPGAFVNLGYGARAHAMGNAYVAASNDPAGILWNPAGIARIAKGEAAASYLRTFAGIPYINFGYVSRFSRTGAYGAAILYSGDDVWHETEFISSCAKLFDEVHPALRPIALGMNLKIRTASTGKGGSGIDRSTGNSFGISMDCGLQFELEDHIQTGLVLRDILQFQKWNNTYSNTKYYEGTPPTIVIGGTFQAGPTLLLTMDGHIPAYTDQTYKLGMGVEKVIFDVLALRGGLFQNLDFLENRKITCGLGVIYMGFGCDATYEFAQEKVFGGSLRISTSWKF